MISAAAFAQAANSTTPLHTAFAPTVGGVSTSTGRRRRRRFRRITAPRMTAQPSHPATAGSIL